MAPKREPPTVARRAESGRSMSHTPTEHHHQAPHRPTAVTHGAVHPIGNQRVRRPRKLVVDKRPILILAVKKNVVLISTMEKIVKKVLFLWV